MIAPGRAGGTLPVGAPALLFSKAKLPFERAAPTAADPKESCRRVVSGDASETVSPSRIGEPESWSEGFLPIVSYGTLPRASEFTIRSKLRTLGGRSIKIDCSAPGRVSSRLEDRLGFSKRLWSAPETPRRRCQILTGVPFPDLSIRLGVLQIPTGVAFPDLRARRRAPVQDAQ